MMTAKSTLMPMILLTLVLVLVAIASLHTRAVMLILPASCFAVRTRSYGIHVAECPHT